MKITERNFINQLKRGNEKALEYVIENYSWVIKTVLKKHLFYLMDYYEECMNDCLLAIWENIDYYNPKRSSFKNWVGGIAKHKAIDYTRKYLKDLETKDIDSVYMPNEDNILKELLQKEISEEVQRMLNCLSKEDQLIFKRLYLEDEEVSEISKDTGHSTSVIYNRLSRGRGKIRNNFNIKGGYKNEKS